MGLISVPCGRSGPSSRAGAVLPIRAATVVVITRSKKKNCRSLRLVLIWIVAGSQKKASVIGSLKPVVIHRWSDSL